MTRVLTGLLIALSTITGYARSQIRAQVDLVVVPVTVRNADGKLITGLTREDFVLFEDDKPQTIANFDIDPWPLSAAIVIDDGMSGTKLKRLYPPFAPPIFVTLTSGFSANDQMAAFRYDKAVHQLSDFTNDPAAIEKSFTVIKQFAESRPDDAPDMLGEKGPRWLRSFLNVLGTGHDAQFNPRAGGVLNDAIHEAATALQGQPADHRKIMLVISDGRIVGDNVHSFEQNKDLLLKNEIQVYGVSTEFETFGSFGNLSHYAEATGGDVYRGTSTKSMESAFGQITEQARYQYVLSYVSNNRAGRAPVFRTITVKTRAGKDKVIHRIGYMQRGEL